MTCSSMTCTCSSISGGLNCPVHAIGNLGYYPEYIGLPCSCWSGPSYTCPLHGFTAAPAPTPPPRPQQGWQCPACLVIHAPRVESCRCQEKVPF